MPQLIDAIGNDFEHTVLSFIPNTAETAYFGFLDGLRKSRRVVVKDALMEMLKSGEIDEAKLEAFMARTFPKDIVQ